MHRFFAPDIADTLVLPEQESQHAVRVLRLVEGDEIEVVDGRGACIIVASRWLIPSVAEWRL